MTDAEIEFVESSAVEAVKTYVSAGQTATIRIRCPIHNKTRQSTKYGYKSLQRDFLHYTAEFSINGKDFWTTFHVYTMTIDGRLEVTNLPARDPPIVFFWNQWGKPYAMKGADGPKHPPRQYTRS